MDAQVYPDRDVDIDSDTGRCYSLSVSATSIFSGSLGRRAGRQPPPFGLFCVGHPIGSDEIGSHRVVSSHADACLRGRNKRASFVFGRRNGRLKLKMWHTCSPATVCVCCPEASNMCWFASRPRDWMLEVTVHIRLGPRSDRSVGYKPDPPDEARQPTQTGLRCWDQQETNSVCPPTRLCPNARESHRFRGERRSIVSTRGSGDLKPGAAVFVICNTNVPVMGLRNPLNNRKPESRPLVTG